MRKIIAAFDGLKYSESTAAYAIDLASRFNAKLFGVFLEDALYHSYKIADLVGQDFVEEERAEYLNKLDAEARANSVKTFQHNCEGAGIVYAIHRDRNVAIQELLHESKYSDIILIQGDETLAHFNEDAPTDFISDLLQKTYCPVIVVPASFKHPEQVVLLYDGDPSSIFAIKQFAYLFPSSFFKVEVVVVKKNKHDNVVPDSKLLKEWLKLYFPHATYSVLTGNPATEIVNFLKNQVQNPLVVLGAYSRSTVSRFMHESLADTIMKHLDVPIFISHK
jgi:nucleotide-binding universal stress UspA family protein